LTTAPAALSGLKVLDLSTERAELCGRVLADLGADVLKVEPPEGATARRLPPFATNGESLYWAAVALGKRSAVIDLDDAAGQQRLRELVAEADVLIESFDPGYLSARGLDAAHAAAINSRLIYVSVSPYGQDGPLAQAPASELTLEASGGLLGLQGDGDRPPIPVGYPQAAFHAGAQAAADVCVALCERDRSGLGQYLDLSMQAAMVWTLMNATGFPPTTGDDPPGTGEHRDAPVPTIFPGVDVPRLVLCADGYAYIGFGPARQASATFDGFVRWAVTEGCCPPELAGVDWFNWGVAVNEGRLTRAQVTAAIEVLLKFVATKRKRDLYDYGLAHDLMVAPLNDVSDLAGDPHLGERGYWWEIDGRRYPGAFARMTETPLAPAGPPPRLGGAAAVFVADSSPTARSAVGSAEVSRGQPFEGLRIADFSWVGVGPIIAKTFADHGATVVRVESSARIDILRERPPWKDNVPGADRSQFMANFNSSKLGLALNLATDEGREVARRVADWADVIVESFTPGTMAKFGLDYETLSKGRPDIIMFSTSLRGQTGPERAYSGFGTQGAALAGLYDLTGWPDRPPVGPWGAYTDMIAPRYGVAALASAIHWRRQSKRGQHIDLSQVEAAIHFIEPLMLDYLEDGHIAYRLGTRSERFAPSGVYAVAGRERYLALSVETAEQWSALRGVLLPDSFARAPWNDPIVRLARADELDNAISSRVATKDGPSIVARLHDAGVPASMVQRPTDLYRDPQLAAREFFVTLDHTVMGSTPYDGPATRFSATPARLRKAAPCIGEDTYEILTELLGLTPEQVAAYAAAGVLS
jgi:crotonobetainyl-CoA:carnitine CoA-transferase CaiB-like acyl-CoA transferase